MRRSSCSSGRLNSASHVSLVENEPATVFQLVSLLFVVCNFFTNCFLTMVDEPPESSKIRIVFGFGLPFSLVLSHPNVIGTILSSFLRLVGRSRPPLSNDLCNECSSQLLLILLVRQSSMLLYLKVLSSETW